MNKPENVGYETEFSALLSLSRGANSRKKILEALLSGSKNCSQVALAVKLNWHTVNRHLLILVKEGLVKSTGFSQRKFFNLTPRGKEVIVSFQGR
jgi:predicted transcriptional regulator